MSRLILAHYIGAVQKIQEPARKRLLRLKAEVCAPSTCSMFPGGMVSGAADQIRDIGQAMIIEEVIRGRS